MKLVCFGHISWSPLMKRNQSMVYYLKETGTFKEILFINPGVRITDLVLKCKLQRSNLVKVWAWKRIIPARVMNGITAATTLSLGPDRVFHHLNSAISILYAGLIKKLFLKGSPFTLLINDFEPEREVYYKKLVPLAAKVIVDISDDFLHFGESPARAEKTGALISFCTAHADVVLCVNDHIKNKFSDGSGKFLVFKNCIHFVPIADAVVMQNKITDRCIKKPIVGYMGVISRIRIDMDLLDTLITRLPGCSFVFLGQDIGGLCVELKRRYPQFHHVPALPYEEMLACISNFDVAIIPHLINEHTEGNDLLKTHIFMALGVPVVSTAASGIEEFRDCIDIGKNAARFSDLVEKRLNRREPGKIARGRERALRNTWQIRIQELNRELRERGIL